jgi:hypothetical protein
MKKFALIFSLALLALSIPLSGARAEDGASPTASSVTSQQSPQPQSGEENNEPRHRISEEHLGLEALPITIVVGAVIIAIGLAVGIGRRRSISE